MDKDLKSMPEKVILDRSMFGETSGGVHYIRADLCNPRATDCSAVDFEALKRDAYMHLEKVADYKRSSNMECKERDMSVARATIDHLASRNLIRGAVEPIEGLDEALESYINKEPFERNFNIVFLAATKYKAMTKGG